MKKIFSLLLSVVMLVSIVACVDLTAYAATQNALWFMDDLKITQVPGGDYSHKGTQNFDVVGVNNNNIKAPFDCKVVKIYKGYDYGNTVVIESTGKVNYADGTIDYMSMCFAHDNDISNLSVGKTIQQGQTFYQTGTYGNVTDRHSHVTVIKGKYKNDMWTKNSYGNYCSPNAINPTKGLFITNTTNVVNSKGLSFKKVNVTSTITFNGTGGTPSSSSLTVTVGKSMGSSIPTATRYGYIFDGWYTSATGGTKYTNSTTITAGNKTLYAHWISFSTYGVAGNLKVGHLYRIVNKKSGYALQPTSDSHGALIQQQPINSSYRQIWKVSLAGGCVFNNAFGGKCLDVKGKSLENKAELQLYGMNDNSQENRIFCLVPRDSGYYSIHPNNSGRAFDIKGGSTSAGAQLQQYYYHGDDNQLFSFQEITNRNVKFYDNLSKNYLPTPYEVYNHSGGSELKDCYTSRNTDYVTTSVNASQNKLVINEKKAGSAGNDMQWSTSINGSYNYDLYDKNTNTMYLCFTAKSSVQGAKMYFRWGYDSTTENLKSITLNTAQTDYVIALPRTANSGANIHPWIDKACVVEITNIQLKSDSSVSVDYNQGDTFTCQNVNYNVNNNNGCFGWLPEPKSTKEGYSFDGWYTDRVRGTKVTSDTGISYNTKLYAHWVKDYGAEHVHQTAVYDKYDATCTEDGSTGNVYCTICNKYISEGNVIPAKGHTSKAIITKATASKDGKIIKTCSECDETLSTTVIPKASSIKLEATTLTYNGKVRTPRVYVKDSNGKTISSSNYTVTYASGRKNVGKYAVKITFKGNYSGTKTLYFTIKPKATSISSVSAKSKGFTVKWKKQSTQVTGYQIQYSTSSKFTNAKTVTVSKNSTTSKTISKLTAKKKYYVRVRTYKTVSGTKYYSSWSKAKSVTTKK